MRENIQKGYMRMADISKLGEMVRLYGLKPLKELVKYDDNGRRILEVRCYAKC